MTSAQLTNPAATTRIPLGVLLVTNGISQLGNRITMIAIPWFVLQTTGSAAKAGITGFAEMLPIVIASFFGGTLVDRIGFKRASVLSDLLAGLAIMAIPALYNTVGLAFWQLLILVFLVGLFNTPGHMARQSLLPDVAELANVSLERANAAFQALPRFSALLGPALAAVLITMVGPANVLWIDAFGYLGSAGLLALAIPSPKPAAGTEAPSSYREDLLEGLRFVRSNPIVRGLISLLVIISLFDTPLFAVVLPVYADQVLASVGALGTIISAFGGGSLAGMVLYGAISHRLPRRPTMVIAFAALATPLVPMAFHAPLWLIAGSAAAGAFVAAPLNPLAMTLLLEKVPSSLRGRAFGLVLALGLAVAPLGMLLAGYCIELFGMVPVLIAIALAFLLAGAVAGLNPAFRGAEDDATPVAVPADATTRRVPSNHPRPSAALRKD